MPIQRLISSLYNSLIPNLNTTILPRIAVGQIKLSDIFDGFLLVQKRKKNIRVKWREKYGCDNWKFGIKLWKPKKNITTCSECGSFHEFHTICRACFGRIPSQKSQTQQREKENSETWFEPNLTQTKNPSANQEPPGAIK